MWHHSRKYNLFPGLCDDVSTHFRYGVLPDEVDLLGIVTKHLSFVRISFAFGFQVFPAFASWHTNTTRPNEHTTIRYHTHAPRPSMH